jgi:hypothetical protein
VGSELNGLAANETGAVALAKAQQGTPRYPGVDDFTRTVIPKGTVVYGGAPGQSGFYVDAASFERSGGIADIFARGSQVQPHPALGYRGGVTAFEVTQDVEAATGTVNANPQYGIGGFTQFYIPSYETALEPIDYFPMSK